MPTKSRKLDSVVQFGDIRRTKPTPELLESGHKRTWTGYQYTESEDHDKSRDGKYHVGGPFFTYRIAPSIPTRDATINGTFGSGQYKYTGPLATPLVPFNLGGFSAPSSDSKYLDPIGAEAVSIVDPTNPNAETGVAIGETLKDGIPIPGIQAWRRRTELAKAAGSEYLNAVFGWLPLVSDLKDTAQSVLDGNTILENYSNSSGSFQHREFAFPDIESVNEKVVGSATASNYGGNVPGASYTPVPLTRREVSTTRRWFSGAFTHLADGKSKSFQRCLGIGSEAEKLFGVSLTPDLVWELTPWSWAIDWFSNAQNVLSNVRAFELAGLVMRYGYIMEETSVDVQYSIPSSGISGVLGNVPPASISYTIKRRREANPFGFGLSWDGLSPTQLAITAALGITRLR